MNRQFTSRVLAIAVAVVVGLMGGRAEAQVGTGGVITYTDINGLNPTNMPYLVGYVVHTFTNSGTFSNATATSVDVLVVGGGGAGRGGNGSSPNSGSGGNGGQLIYSNTYPVSIGDINVTVGDGGVGVSNGTGGTGGNSVFGSLTATGGVGATYATSVPPGTYGGSGAGGAGAGPGNGPTLNAGGPGLTNAISGTDTAYAGGGGGGFTDGGNGGSGGGGHGKSYSGSDGTAGGANTGGGGGGWSSSAAGAGFAGGSGIVIVRYVSVVDIGNTGTGGTITYTDVNGLNPRTSPPYVGGYVVHTFTNSDTFGNATATNVNVLVVAGGGGGGCVGTTGGGGGAGGVTNNTAYAVVAGSNYTVTVGAGGLGGKRNAGARNATSGGNSVFGAITALGGGNGAGNTQNAGTGSGVVGSGGGGAYPSPGGAKGTGTPGQGKDGGAGQTASLFGQGGGGGAGSDGQGGSGSYGGYGGTGLYFAAFSSWGDANHLGYFGGGGGGSYRSGTATAGGAGGWGGGGQGGDAVGLGGQPNTGGGGGGADYNGAGGANVTAGDGGSGIVIVRYPYASASDQLLVSVSSPTAGQAFLVGSPISATATVQSGTGPYQVSFFADTAGGGMVQVGTTQSGSGPTFAQSLGSPPNGTYHVYASVTDSATPTPATATSATITFSADGTAPTLAGSAIVDNKSGGPVGRNIPVTYTVTFSEDMDASTVDAADFGNAGSSTITVGSITETSPGVFSVVVTPTSVGTLKLKIKAGAVLTDAAGNALDTTSAILDDTTLTVAAIQIVNIDFNGLRSGDAGHAGTYVGVSAAGTGTVFNPITADSTGGNDNLTVSASGLIDETGTSTTVSFSISPVGGDNESAQTFAPPSLYDDFIFNNSAGNNSPAGSPFTISGLGDSPTADVYFYLNSYNYQYNPSGQISISGVAGNGEDGTYNGLRATRFLGVTVSGGSITGVFGSNGKQTVLGGLTVYTLIPVEQPAGTVFRIR